VQALGAARRPERGPGGERRLRRLHGLVDLLGAAARHLGEHGLVDRRAVDERLATGDPPPADEVVGRDRDAGDVDARALDGGRHGAGTACSTARALRTVSRSSTV
jgi:hypothetical protein